MWRELLSQGIDPPRHVHLQFLDVRLETSSAWLLNHTAQSSKTDWSLEFKTPKHHEVHGILLLLRAPESE